MKLITPSEALTKLQGFIDRIERIDQKKHITTKALTYDLNRLKYEYKKIHLWASIGVFNKNQERAKSIIDKCSYCYAIATKYLFDE